MDVREIGRLLRVASILEGSVEHSGDRIRVVAHLSAPPMALISGRKLSKAQLEACLPFNPI